MKFTGLEIPSVYKNVSEYLLFDYTDEIQLGKELCSVRLIKLETADLFKNKNTDSLDRDIPQDNYTAVITVIDPSESNPASLVGCDDKDILLNNGININKERFIKGFSDFIMNETPGLIQENLEISIKI